MHERLRLPRELSLHIKRVTISGRYLLVGLIVLLYELPHVDVGVWGGKHQMYALVYMWVTIMLR